MSLSTFLEKYRRGINPPYKGKDLLNNLGTVLILIAIPITAYAVLTSREPSGKAATTPTLSLLPAASNVNQGALLTVEVWEESQTQPVNAVQANFSYDVTKFDFVSVDNTTSAVGVEAENTGGNGSVSLARGVASVNGQPPVPVIGLKLVTKVTFRAKQSPGASSMSFTAGSAIVRSSDNANILDATVGATYTVVNLPPTVNLTSPTANALVKGTVSVSATATDDTSVARVEFLVDNIPQSTDTTSPYSFSWNSANFTDGSHTVSARAFDGSNGSAISNLTVTVDNALPTVSISTPASGVQVRGTQTVTASASDNTNVSSVDFLVDGTVRATDTSSPYSFSWNTATFSDGAHTLSARATDSAGNIFTSANVSVTVDNTLPTVSITSPTNSAIVRGSITISANASDGVGLNTVEFLDGSNVLNTDTTSPYSFSLNTTSLSNGAHSLSARATDNAGNQTTTSVTVTVDNQAPSVPSGLVAAPTSSSQINLTWSTSTDNVAISGYEVYRNNILITTVTTTGFNDTGLTNQTSYSYFVRAKDTAGNLSSASATVSATTGNVADLNGDSIINIFDLSILLTRWGTNNSAADLNKNGTVDIFDLSILLSRWGT